jgi:hypothetical protein
MFGCFQDDDEENYIPAEKRALYEQKMSDHFAGFKIDSKGNSPLVSDHDSDE